MATPLAERHCVACEPGTPPLPREEIDRLLPEVPNWQVEEAEGHLRLLRTVKFKGFMPGVELVNRIAAIAANLSLMGANVEEHEDGLKIPGQQNLRGAELESFGDHRIAMAFAVAALRAQGESLIRGAEAAAVSYPAFFPTLEGLLER